MWVLSIKFEIIDKICPLKHNHNVTSNALHDNL